MSRLRRWPLAVLIAVDQLANAILMGNEDDTISSRSWKAYEKGRPWARVAVPVIDLIFLPFGGPGHCRRSAERDET